MTAIDECVRAAAAAAGDVATPTLGAASLDEDALSREITEDTGMPPQWAPVPYDSVQASVARVRACEALPHRDRVRGFVFHVEDGRLVEVA